jgi:UDP:flavonoid glycosyltransferase YjiC (YdhE family)
MRVLFTTTPGRGHYLAMAPLAAACLERGHEVRWATAEVACVGLRAQGFDAVAAGLPDGVDFGGAWVFGPARAGPMLERLLPLVREWEPSLLVCDTVETAGPLAAASVGVPHATHSYGSRLPQSVVDQADREMAPLWREHGLEPRPHGGLFDHLYLDIYPRSLQANEVPAGTVVQPVRPAPIVTPGPNRDAPLVYVTFGTVFGRDLSGHRTVLAGIADLPIRVLVTIGPGADPAALGEQPPNVEIAEFVPQAETLPRAAAVVSHAGSGTFLAALAAGLPQLLLPIGADQFRNAAAGAEAGAAIRIEPDALDAGAVRAALVRLLDEPAYAAAATRLQKEIEAMPAPSDVVPELERLADPSPVGAQR